MSTAGPYRLIHSVLAHDGPIRCIAVAHNGELITGCQSDAPNFRRWKETESSSWEEVGEAIPHDHWVTAVTSLGADISREFYSDGCIITGCQDSQIRIFSFEGVLLQTLRGHGKGVVSFSWTASNQLVSGSWDGTAKVWDLSTSTCIQTLGPHENGVQVLALTNNLIATTSTGESVNGKPANFKLRIWDPVSGRQVGDAIQDHQGSIRSIAALPAIDGFVTTANDGTVILRTIDGQAIDIMQHPVQEDGAAPFVFGSCALDTAGGMDVVSCGEDGSVLVWSGAELVQSVPHPCCVWAVKALPGTDGDFVTCGDDGFLRIFSRNISKTQSPAVEQLNTELALEVAEAKARRHNGPSAEEIAKAPLWEQRAAHPGKSADQVCVFNQNGSLVAAQWISGSWVIVGTVTSTGDGGYLNEVWYDHIMPVEIETPSGVMTLKLGHNNGENPFSAAQRFIDQNQLQQAYLSQIADWITARSGQTAPTIGGSAGAGPASGASTAGYSAQPPSPPARTYTYMVTGLSTYDDVPPMPKLLAKIQEFSAALGGDVALSAAEVGQLEQLSRVLGETSYYHSSSVTAAQLQPLCRALLAWPVENLFPLYDMLRVVAIHPNGAETLAGPLRAQLQQVLLRTTALLSSASAGSAGATTLTATRFLCNCIKSDALRTVAYSESSLTSILRSLLPHACNPAKLVRAAVSRIALNSAGFATRSGVFAKLSLSAESSALLLQSLSAQLAAESESAEVVCNSVCALGTLEVSGVAVGEKVVWRGLLNQVQERWRGQQAGSTVVECATATLAMF